MLSVQFYRERVVATLFPDSHPEMKYWPGGQLIHWRWASLINVLEALLQREDALKTHWNFEKIARAGSTRSGDDADDADGNGTEEVSTQAVRSSDLFRKADWAITSPMFWAYTRFLQSTHGYLNKISSWCESCPCHGPEQRCVLKGRRCPELADGRFNSMLEVAYRTAHSDFLSAVAGLTPKDASILRTDFVASSDLIFTEARIKTSHWHGSLPWALCGIASDCEKSGREAANLVQSVSETYQAEFILDFASWI